jgi:hypothetical protein
MSQLIPYITNSTVLQFTPKHFTTTSTAIPVSSALITATISTSFPTTQSILYDDLGHVHAISFRPDDGSNGDKPSCKHLYHGSSVTERFVDNASSTRQSPFEPSKFAPSLSPATQALISSEENIKALQSHQTTLVQNHLIKHFKALAVTDTQQVQSKLQHALLSSRINGLIRTSPPAPDPLTRSTATTSKAAEAVKPYPLPAPLHMPRPSTMKYWDEVGKDVEIVAVMSALDTGMAVLVVVKCLGVNCRTVELVM